jgi:hypothetical protein
MDPLRRLHERDCPVRPGSLRAAIEAANASGTADTITFHPGLAGGTILLSSGQLTIDKAGAHLTIDGDGTPDITVDAQDISRVFFINEDADATLQGLVITGGNVDGEDGGGIFNDGGTLTVTNSTISGNTGSGIGGRLRQACLSAGLLFSLIPAAPAQEDGASPARQPPGPSVEVEVTGGLLTLHANGAPLAEVLRAIGEAGAFEVVLRGGFAAPVRDSFAEQPLVDALRRLVAGHSVVIVHEAPDPASGAAALRRIAVIESRSAVDAESAPPPAASAADPEVGAADPPARTRAAPKVGSPAWRAAIETAAHALASHDANARSRAVAALTRLDGPEARRLLRERALADDHVEVRMQAVAALASANGARAVNVLGQALNHDPEPAVRMAAILALGRVGGNRARGALERAARDHHREIRLAAERALTTLAPRGRP